MGVTEILYSFRFVLDRKTAEELSESSGLESSERISGHNYILSDTGDSTSGPLNYGITGLHLFRTLFTVLLKSREPAL